jgi:pSer/pThr/pTyr-binding forkhead associated (FHA) protein
MSIKDKLKTLELKLQSLVEANLARQTSTPDLSHELVKNLVEAMSRGLQEEADQLLAPNHFTIRLAPSPATDLRASPALLISLAEAIQNAGEEAGVSFFSKPNISILEDPHLSPGEVKIAARNIKGPPESTKAFTQVTDEDPEIPLNAFLIINGNQVYPLSQLVVNIGRRIDNNLVIDNPSISRIHAQLRAIDNHYVLFDLGSTGGTFVNGERINRCVLYPGDVISLATIPVVYGQDSPRPLDEAQGYSQPYPVDQKKTVTRSKKSRPPEDPV